MLLSLLSLPTNAKAGRKCGRSTVQQTRLIGSINAQVGAWPWQVALTIRSRFICGGVVISPEWVLTAAHCVGSSDSYTVVLGEHVRGLKETGEQKISVSKVIRHPRYDSPSYFNNDIALLKLSRSMMYSKTVQPICLPDYNKDLAVGSKCYVTGWGATTYFGKLPTILQQVHLKIISFGECWMKNNKSAPITDQMICAANTKSQIKHYSGCHGDSGGPLVYRDTDGSWVLHGIVNWGSATCDTTDAYSVFARVSKFRNWIDTYMNSKKVALAA